MNFEWDDRKNEINLAKHGFDFNDASRIFQLPMVIDLDDREVYGEDRSYWDRFTRWTGRRSYIYRTQRGYDSDNLNPKSTFL